MRILFVSSQFPNSLQPELGVFSSHIVREMSFIAEIKVIAPIPSVGQLKFIDRFKKYKTDLPIPFIEITEGIMVYHPKYFAVPGMGFIHHITMISALEPLVKKIHDEWKIDVVNCHWLFPDGVALQHVCNKYGIPIMLTALGCDLNKYIKSILRKRPIRQALIHSNKVSVLNRQMFDTCVKLGVPSHKIAIVPNGVDLCTFSIRDRKSCRTKLGFQSDAQIVLFVGSLVEVKNVDTLLRSFKLVTDGHKNVKLVLIGSGYLYDALVNLSNSLGICQYVNFIGQIPHEQLVDWMNAADCLCLPSIREGHPNVMMEALACGIPVVASSIGSIPDFINRANGCLIKDPANYNEIAEMLLLCLSTIYEKNTIRSTVCSNSWSKCASDYLAELESVTKS